MNTKFITPLLMFVLLQTLPVISAILIFSSFGLNPNIKKEININETKYVWLIIIAYLNIINFILICILSLPYICKKRQDDNHFVLIK